MELNSEVKFNQRTRNGFVYSKKLTSNGEEKFVYLGKTIGY